MTHHPLLEPTRAARANVLLLELESELESELKSEQESDLESEQESELESELEPAAVRRPRSERVESSWR